jgi:hypothetical protein
MKITNKSSIESNRVTRARNALFNPSHKIGRSTKTFQAIQNEVPAYRILQKINTARVPYAYS